MPHQEFLLYDAISTPDAIPPLKTVDWKTSRLYLGEGYDQSSWNTTILAGMACDVLDGWHSEEEGFEKVDENYLINELRGQMRSSRAYWRLGQGKVGESPVSAVNRVSKAMNKRRSSSIMNSRKQTVSIHLIRLGLLLMVEWFRSLPGERK
jgi:hypothetical protein